jgi:hypothetical protein
VTIHHANAIAENRAAREWAGRVDRNYRHATTARTDATEERRNESALAGSGWPGHPDHVSPPSQRKERVQRLQSVRVSVFDQGRQTGQYPWVRPLKTK